MKSIHDLLGMAVVTVQEGIRLGTVRGVELDPTATRIAYLHFDGADTRADGVRSTRSGGLWGEGRPRCRAGLVRRPPWLRNSTPARPRVTRANPG